MENKKRVQEAADLLDKMEVEENKDENFMDIIDGDG